MPEEEEKQKNAGMLWQIGVFNLFLVLHLEKCSAPREEREGRRYMVHAGRSPATSRASITQR